MKTETPNDLSYKYRIEFEARGSLSRTVTAPVAMNDPVGLVLFGDSSAIYIAHVTDSGSWPYPKLSSIRATTYIHGWALNAGKLYLLDGFELSYWDVPEGRKTRSLNLLGDTDATTATAALKELQKATQRVEWATLLEQAEDEWVKLTAEQAAAKPGSDERDRLDNLAADYLKMLRALREMTGNTGGSAGSKTLVADLKKALAEKRKAAAPWLFSAPLVRSGSLEDTLPAVFIMQGNGTIYTCDKLVSETPNVKKFGEPSEPQIALLEDRAANQRYLGCIRNSTLYILDPKDYREKNHWAPTPAPAVGSRQTLTAANGQFWWATETGVYALQPNVSGVLQQTWKTGAPWAIKQVGRYPIPQTPYNPPVNPNDLFDTMNIKAWIAKRSEPSAALTEGMMAQLFLSDDKGKYTSPAEGKSYILTLPSPGESTTTWTSIKPHPTNPLVLVSDSRGVSMQCRYPGSIAGQQLIPHWTTAPWLRSVTTGSPVDRVLAKPWDAPKVRPLSKPYPDMIAQLWEGNPDTRAIGDLVRIVPDGKILDRHLRYLIWFALLGFDSLFIEIPLREGAHGMQRFSEFPRWCSKRFGLDAVWSRFGLYGNVFRIPDQGAAKGSFRSTSVAVNFDPPWTWPTSGPPMDLFHSPPPAWYDPWGYNRPGEFVSTQPSPTYIDPFCFDGQLKFPQRTVTLDGNFKGRSWATFTDNDPASLLANVPSNKDGEFAQEPVELEAGPDPNTLVVSTDEEQQRTTFQILSPKRQRLIFDANTHKFETETTPMGSIGDLVVGPPTVFLNPAKTFPTAWCVMNINSRSARLRNLVTFDTDRSGVPWDLFIAANKPKYGPTGGGKTWQIDLCPLPDDSLPQVVLDGYGLPAS
ncbi:MAG TPA: hypothetical protein VFY60_17100 [Pyrinomonadaceae bacterium]|nr:hypothetical protein [Pyrinomonadaceae bacterium]